ncbi:TonB-dependent receptor domain-containing protein [Sphingomonas sp. TDK1]|uniref:TonB-dependent receptor domain-containing protein n=1 Tax=Sphingomonas sp. TDK1 TaxID=453247 RepID=UPI002FC3C122
MNVADQSPTMSRYTNSFDSRNQGLDAVLTYRFDIGEGKATLGLNANYTDTKILRASPVITADRERLLELERFVPRWKGNASFTYEAGRFGMTAVATYFGKWTDYGANVANDQTGSAEILANLELRYRLSEAFGIAVGGENIFNNYPDREARASQIANGIKYLRFAPIGFNGGFWYVRGTAKF